MKSSGFSTFLLKLLKIYKFKISNQRLLLQEDYFAGNGEFTEPYFVIFLREENYAFIVTSMLTEYLHNVSIEELRKMRNIKLKSQ